MGTSKERTWIGVDVSKAHWDVAVEGSGKVKRFVADTAGSKALLNWLSQFDSPHVCLEATGSYHRRLVRALQQAEIAVSVLNPAQVRNLARAQGELSKTDKIDALLIARFGMLMQPSPSEKPSENQEKLRSLRTRRQQVDKTLTQEKNRLGVTDDPAARKSLQEAIDFHHHQLKSLDKQIRQLVCEDAEFQERMKVLISVPGIGVTTAAALLAEMPELGHLNRGQTAKLAGLAPINRDSGTLRGKRMIGGGRVAVRKGLYMATLVATRHNPTIKRFYQQLLRKGKNKMTALTACMRKLLIILNVMLKENKTWNSN